LSSWPRGGGLELRRGGVTKKARRANSQPEKKKKRWRVKTDVPARVDNLLEGGPKRKERGRGSLVGVSKKKKT